MATGSVKFVYNRQHDVHIAYPDWTLETEDDCKAWHKQYADYFTKLGKKVDMIVILDKFAIGASIGPVWGKYRADMHKRFTRYSVRVHPSARVGTFIATSATIHKAPSDEAPDLESAFEMIALQREHGEAAL